ncbi:MAG TPA: SDR family NAD(P)-dependent oxidoreductase [Gemmatimonadales bacterium]|nr:SDR family NAD(P)-dependent oxidoreductase [Gemmatimonadales bacterium]
MRDLRGCRVLITGGARGLGRALAVTFADRGAHLVLVDLDQVALDAAAAELRAEGRSVSAYACDVTDEDRVLVLRDQVLADGPIDVLVNNAGTVAGGAFLDVPAARHRRTIDVNVAGLVAVTHAFLPTLLTRPRGAILNVASASAFLALPWGTTYAASKWAVLGFGESLAEELHETGHGHVRITTLCPSYIDTGLFTGARPARLTWLLSPRKVAARAVRAVERGEARVILPWTAALLVSGLGWLPRGAFHAIARWFGVSSSMREWKGRDP